MIRGGFGWTASSSTGSATPSRRIITRWSGNATVQCGTSGSPSRTNFSATVSDSLADLGSPVEDQILILNILRGLNQRFKHVVSIIRRYSSFPNFLKVRDDLLLEEIHMDSTSPSAAPTALYTNAAPQAARPPSSMPSRPPSGGNNGNGGHQNKNNNKNRNDGHGSGNNGRNSNGSGGRNSSYG
jgi:hypothetical protein